MFKLIQFSLLASLLMGCAVAQFVDENDLLVRKVVEQGTMRYIQARPESEWHAKAVRVREVATRVKNASSSDLVTLDELRDIVLEELDLRTPADQAIGRDLFDTIAAVAEQQVQEDLSESGIFDRPAQYRRIADWVIAATRYYPASL